MREIEGADADMEQEQVEKQRLDRRRFLAAMRTTALGAVGGGLLTGCGGLDYTQSRAATNSDSDILNAAKIAEASAVTIYTEIINHAPFFTRLSSSDQNYFRAARQEDMAHYALLVGATGNHPSAVTTFYFPVNMFKSAKVTLDTAVTLEEAFIAAYLIAVRSFSSADLRVLAARILGVQSEHRLLLRTVASDIAPADGGPITTLKGLANQEEAVDPPNNNLYERTYNLAGISDVVAALKPFIDPVAAASKGFDTTQTYTFQPFTPTAPSSLGDING